MTLFLILFAVGLCFIDTGHAKTIKDCHCINDDNTPYCCGGETYDNKCSALCNNIPFPVENYCQKGTCKEQLQCLCPMIYDVVCCVNKDAYENEVNEYSSLCVANCFDENPTNCQKGTCAQIDSACQNDYIPICCQGKSYPNECSAKYDGVDVSECKPGECVDQFCECDLEFEPICCSGKNYINECVAQCQGVNPIECASNSCIYDKCAHCNNDVQEPICCDGQTYTNPCEAECAGISARKCIDDCQFGTCESIKCDCSNDKYEPICCNGIDFPNICHARCKRIGVETIDSCLRGPCFEQSNYGACPLRYEPVCCDGEQYANLCDAHYNGYLKGECNESSSGWRVESYNFFAAKKTDSDSESSESESDMYSSSSDSNDEQIAGVFGSFPLHGGNMEKQQVSLHSDITIQNINYLQQRCIFDSINPMGLALAGYITVDDEDHAYFGDTSGHIRCFDILTCSLIWSVNISDIVDQVGFASRSTVSLFQDKNGEKALLFGTPNEESEENGIVSITTRWHCWVVALRLNDGSLLWKTKISETGSCLIHGLQIDNNGFAYAGTSSYWNNLPPDGDNIHIGKAFKIDINTGELINEWYTLPQIQIEHITDDLYYSGASIWPIQSVIDNYFVFGTGNLYTYPKRVEQCMLGNIDVIPEDNINANNPCGEDQSEYLNWRCFENIDIYPDSLIILNKNTFELESFIKFSGVDIWSNFCEYRVTNEEREKIPECTKAFNGPDADVAAVASYHFNNELYVAVAQKSGEFYIVSIPNGELKVSKKIGPWSTNGGLAPFSMAVDENNLIAIVSFRGPGWTMVTSPWYRYKMADGTIICDAGSIHAIDLTTGYTMWQWINPYAKMGMNECNSSEYDNYIDPTVGGTCQRAFDGSEMLLPNVTIPNYNGNVIIPPIDELTIPYLSSIRALNIGPVTISNNMVFIPTMTGEIFIHHIFNGEYIKTLTCPDYVDNNGIINRQGIRSGITIYDDKLMFYCGSDNSFVGSGAPNGQIIVMSLRF